MRKNDDQTRDDDGDRASGSNQAVVDEVLARELGNKDREATEHVTKPWILSLALEGLRNSRHVDAALKLLVEANILLEIKVPTGGRPKFEWVVNPRFRS